MYVPTIDTFTKPKNGWNYQISEGSYRYRIYLGTYGTCSKSTNICFTNFLDLREEPARRPGPAPGRSTIPVAWSSLQQGSFFGKRFLITWACALLID